MSHSKRNTSRAVFTSHERALAKSAWSSSSARLNRDSFLPFGSCSLCLSHACDPVACQRGDIFCRECALSNIVTQKKELKRIEKQKRNAERQAVLKHEEREAEDQKRSITDFESTQAGLKLHPGYAKSSNETLVHSHVAPGPTTQTTMTTTKALEALTASKETHTTTERQGSKRKLELDEDEMEHAAKADRIRARKAIDNEKLTKHVLPSFWTPSLTPDVKNTALGSAKSTEKVAIVCPASNDIHPHPISLHQLITLNFTEEVHPTTKARQQTCPACRKVLSNASAPIVAKDCGHVVCQPCVDQFLVPTRKDTLLADVTDIINCFVCNKPVAINSADPGKKHRLPIGLVALKSEGTGFSARGASTVEKCITSFQC